MRLEQLDQQMNNYSERLVRMEAKFESMEKYIANIDKNVEKILKFQEQLETWKTQVHDNTKELKNLSDLCSQLKKVDEFQQEKLDKIDRKLLKWIATITAVVGTFIFILDHFIR